MSKTKVKSLSGKLTPLEVKREGQHVGIRNTESPVEDCVLYQTGREPKKGDTWILPPHIRSELAFRIFPKKDVYYGVIYPKEKKFNKKLWEENLIEQELSEFTIVSQVVQWGDSTYINLIRNFDDKDQDYLFSTAYNWEE